MSMMSTISTARTSSGRNSSATRRAVTLCLLSVTAVFASACGDGGTEAVAARAVVTASPTTLELSPGVGTVIVYSVERIAGHISPVNLAVRDVPQGIIAYFSAPVVQRGVLTSSLTVSVSPLATPGNYSFSTVASGVGVEETSIPVTVNVVAQDIALTVSQPNVSLAQGQSLSTVVNVERIGGFNGNIGFAVFGLPAGVTASFSPASLTANQTQSTLVLAATLPVSIGSSTLTVQATSQALVSSKPVQLSITPATIPAVVLSANPILLELVRGTSGEATINLQRFAGFQGPLTFTLTGVPAAVIATIAPVAAGANSTVIRFDADLGAIPAQSIVTVRASGTGIQDATLPFALRVMEIPGFQYNFAGNAPNAQPLRTMLLSVPRGTTRSAFGRIERISGFSEEITLSIPDLPAGITSDLPITYAATAEANQFIAVAFTVNGSTAPGTYEMTLRGVAKNGLVVETLATIVVE